MHRHFTSQVKTVATTLYQSKRINTLSKLTEQYVKFRTPIFSTGACVLANELYTVSTGTFHPTFFLFSAVASAWLSYASIGNNRNYHPTLLSKISSETSGAINFYTHEVKEPIITTEPLDIVLDHEVRYKVYMPFQTLFWKSFLLNKTDMGAKNEIRMLVVPYDQQSIDAKVITNKYGEKQYSLYVVRGKLSEIAQLRSAIQELKINALQKLNPQQSL